MALTKDFRETTYARAQCDAAFHRSLLTEAANAYFGGGEAVGKAVLKDLVNSTIGFEKIGGGSPDPEQESASHARTGRKPEYKKLFCGASCSPRKRGCASEGKSSVTGGA
jgi:hypothetical protein